MDQLKRIKAILVSPESEWPVIAQEATPASRLITHYVAILALVPALAHVIGVSLVGWYAPILLGLVGGLVIYVSAIVVVYGLAFGLNALASRFGAQKDFAGAFKLAVYSLTPAWLAGIFLIVPGLSFLAVLSLYGTYLIWLGLPVLMGAPADRLLRYAAAATGWALLLVVLLGLVEVWVTGLLAR